MSFASGVPQGAVLHTDRIQAEGVVVRQKKKIQRKKILIFGVMPYAKMGSAKKNLKNEIFFAPASLFAGMPESRVGCCVCLTACCPPPPPPLCLMPHFAPCFAFTE